METATEGMAMSNKNGAFHIFSGRLPKQPRFPTAKKYKSYSLLVKMFFHCRQYHFYLLYTCIKFTARSKTKLDISPCFQRKTILRLLTV